MCIRDRYIDECHMEIGGGWDNLCHVYQFAEMMERNGSTVIPLRSSLPAQCFSVLPSSGELILLTRGENGYSPCYDFSTPDARQNREFADDCLSLIHIYAINQNLSEGHISPRRTVKCDLWVSLPLLTSWYRK